MLVPAQRPRAKDHRQPLRPGRHLPEDPQSARQGIGDHQGAGPPARKPRPGQAPRDSRGAEVRPDGFLTSSSGRPGPRSPAPGCGDLSCNRTARPGPDRKCPGRSFQRHVPAARGDPDPAAVTACPAGQEEIQFDDARAVGLDQQPPDASSFRTICCPSRTASRMSYGRLPPDQGRSDGEAASVTALAKFLSQVI